MRKKQEFEERERERERENEQKRNWERSTARFGESVIAKSLNDP